jgi:hypothetical protein
MDWITLGTACSQRISAGSNCNFAAKSSTGLRAIPVVP